MMLLRWKTSALSSAFYTALQLASRFGSSDFDSTNQNSAIPVVDVNPDLKSDAAIAYVDLVGRIDRGLQDPRLPSTSPQWRSILALACRDDDFAGSIDPIVPSEIVGDLLYAYREVYPKIDEQLQLRATPIRDQWTGYGGGLSAHLGRYFGKQNIDTEIDVWVVQPFVNGMGISLINENLLVFEGVLVNPLSNLPEVLRLAWHAVQMKLTREHEHARETDADMKATRRREESLTIADSIAIGTLVATLAAGEVLELCRCDEATLEYALKHWIDDPRPRAGYVPAVFRWWETFLQTKPELEVAITALQRSLSAINS